MITVHGKLSSGKSRAAQLTVMKDALIEYIPILRRTVKADHIPAVYEWAFECKLDRIVLSKFQEPGLADDQLASNRHYARFFTLLAVEPGMAEGGVQSFRK